MSKAADTGRDVQAVRLAQGYSQEQAALESGLSVTWWQQIEKGSANITLDTLRRVACTLGVEPQVLGVLRLSDEEIRTILRRAPQVEPGTGRLQIGENIILLRKIRKLTQRQLAQLARVSPARLRDIEHGCANATIVLLERIAGAQEVPLLALSALTTPEEDILTAVRAARAIAGREVA